MWHSQSSDTPLAPKYSIYLFLHINFSNEFIFLWVGRENVDMICYLTTSTTWCETSVCSTVFPTTDSQHSQLSSLSEVASHSHFNHIQVEQSTIIIMITTLEKSDGCSTFLVQEFLTLPTSLESTKNVFSSLVLSLSLS